MQKHKTIKDFVVTEVVDGDWLLGIETYNSGNEMVIPKELALHILKLQKKTKEYASVDKFVQDAKTAFDEAEEGNRVVIQRAGDFYELSVIDLNQAGK